MNRGKSAKSINYNINEIFDVKSLKNEFRKSTKKYALSEHNELLYIKKIKLKNHRMNKIESKFEYLRVPTIKQLNEKLYEFHAHNFHVNKSKFINMFQNHKIGFYGLNVIIEEYISNCPACVQTARTMHRLDPIKSITVDGPNFRYEFDLTYFNSDLETAYGVKYLLSIIDQFSRKAIIYKEKNKRAEPIIKHILEFCAHNNFPKQFCSDN